MLDIVINNIEYGLFHAFEGIVRDLGGGGSRGAVEEYIYDVYGREVTYQWNRYMDANIKEEA